MRRVLLLLILLLASVGPAVAGPVEDLAVRNWGALSTNTIADVYPSPQPPGNPATIITGWSGGAFDGKRDRLVVWGGGHGDYGGNEVYAFDLSTLAWSRIWGPGTIPADALTRSPCVDAESDGAPASRHTYGGSAYAPPPIDRFYNWGGSLACGSGGATNSTWAFDFDGGGGASAWTERASTSGFSPDLEHVLVYDSYSRKFFMNFGNSSQWRRYDPVANTWTNAGGGSGLNHAKYCAIDPGRRKIVCTGCSSGECAGESDSTALVWTIASDGSVSGGSVATTGPTTINTCRYPGLTFDPVTDRIIGWCGGSTVYSFHPDTNVWTAVTALGGATPTDPPNQGTYGRFFYSPKKNVFGVVNSTTGSVYLFRLTSGRGSELDVPNKQWVAYEAPAAFAGTGIPGDDMKHVTPAYHPPSGKLFLHNGDYQAGGSHESSYRQETWSLNLNAKWLAPDTASSGWVLEYPYCGSGIQPKHPDYTGFTWVPSESRFYMVPGVMESTSTGNCSGETAANGSDTNFRQHELMTFTPANSEATKWAVAPNGGSTGTGASDTWNAHYNAATHKIYRPQGIADAAYPSTGGGSMGIYDLTAESWSVVTSGPNNSWKELSCIHQGRQEIYWGTTLDARFWRFDIAANDWDDLGPLPTGFPAIGNTQNLTYVACDEHNGVIYLWRTLATVLGVYDIVAQSWTTYPIVSDKAAAGDAHGRMIAYDPGNNVVMVLGARVEDSQPNYFYLWRYGFSDFGIEGDPPPPPGGGPIKQIRIRWK